MCLLYLSCITWYTDVSNCHTNEVLYYNNRDKKYIRRSNIHDAI